MKHSEFGVLIYLFFLIVFDAHAGDKCTTIPTSKTIINVLDKGAKGNGKTDDTAAIQEAIDQVTGTGGTVLIPKGTYMINAVKSILVKSDMTLRMSSGAILRAIPNDKTGYSIIKIDGASNINVIGGTLIGERDQHFGVAGEWGMGITIRSASNLAIEDVTAKNGWGDGFYIGGASRNIKFCSVIADNNRRQGMSVISVDGMVVSNSIFKNTGGTAPQAGIDIEPNDNDAVTNVQILKSQFIDNKGLGIQIYVGLNTKRRVDDIFIQGNTVTGNQAGGIALVNSNYNNIKNNLVKENKHFGILLTKGTKGNLISKNSLSNNTKIIDQGENTVSGNFYD